MPGLTYYNGQVAPYEDIKIPLTDRSIFFGDAVYEVMIGRCGRVYQLSEHILRLMNGAQALEIELGMTISELSSIIDNLVKDYQNEEFLLYLQLSRKCDKREHIYAHNSHSNLLIYTDNVLIRESLVPISLITQKDLRYE